MRAPRDHHITSLLFLTLTRIVSLWPVRNLAGGSIKVSSALNPLFGSAEGSAGDSFFGGCVWVAGLETLPLQATRNEMGATIRTKTKLLIRIVESSPVLLMIYALFVGVDE